MSVFDRRSTEPDPRALLQPGEMVTVRSYAGSRADEEPRAIVVGGQEIPITEIVWRAVVQTTTTRTRAFVVRAGGARVRLAFDQDSESWTVERLVPDAADPVAGK